MKLRQIMALSAATLLLGACGKDDANAPEPVAEAPGCAATVVADPVSFEIAPGLTARILSTGCGEVTAQMGHVAEVHYTGWLLDASAANGRGEKFDSSHDRSQTFKFPLGGRVIKGWNLGVEGMLVGEVRELTISPELGYGDRDIPKIPANSTLVFEVQLVELEGSVVEAIPNES